MIAPASIDTGALNGTHSWLQWLQKLLNAKCLILYGISDLHGACTVEAQGHWPPGSRQFSATRQLVARCAKQRCVVRAKVKDRIEASIECIPLLPTTTDAHSAYVLMIERDVPGNLDSQSQANLVAWAFKAHDQFAVSAENSSTAGFLPRGRLVKWCVDQLSRPQSLEHMLSLLMQEVQRVTGASLCYLARLHLHKNTVQSASLIAMSGRQKIDARLPAHDSVLRTVQDVYGQQPLPLTVFHKAGAESTLFAQHSVAQLKIPCARLLLPLMIEGQAYAVCLERQGNAFDVAQRNELHDEILAATAFLLAADLKKLSISAAVKRRMRIGVIALKSGPIRALLSGVAGVTVGAFLLLPSEHRISAKLSVEASDHQVLIAPTDGFVKSVRVRAGDKVSKGDVLATLDDLDLQLEQQKLQSEFLQNQQAYSKALALHDRVEISRLKEESVFVQTELTQLEIKRQRMAITAPADGIVLSGSWDDFLGAAVSAGDTLFALGSSHAHRLVMKVSEYDVNAIRVGQQAAIRLSADPSTALAGVVTAVMPLAMPTAGQNSVEVHAALSDNIALRPGMEGLAKVLVGRQPRAKRWFERALARVIWLGWRLGVLE